MSKPVPAPVDGWTFARDVDGRLSARATSACVAILNDELCVGVFNYESDADIPLSVVRALLADSQPLTVGAALADPRVQSGECVVEYTSRRGEWRQLRFAADRRAHPEDRIRLDIGWCPWVDVSFMPPTDTFARHCRLVPLADADAPPDSRGPIGGEP